MVEADRRCPTAGQRAVTTAPGGQNRYQPAARTALTYKVARRPYICLAIHQVVCGADPRPRGVCVVPVDGELFTLHGYLERDRVDNRHTWQYATIVVLMFNSFAKNDLLLSMMSTLAGDDVDLESARKAFEVTTGDFRAKFIASCRLKDLDPPVLTAPRSIRTARHRRLRSLLRGTGAGPIRR